MSIIAFVTDPVPVRSILSHLDLPSQPPLLNSCPSQKRTREIGVRMALGADRRDVRRMVLRQGMILAGIGVVVGLVAAVGLTRLMSSLLFGVDATDPVTFGAVAALLTAVALVASYLPALRASRTDPVEALRFE